MTLIIETSKMPTSVANIPSGTKAVHESCLRAYHILEEVKIYLGDKVPHHIILELIGEMESGPGGYYK